MKQFIKDLETTFHQRYHENISLKETWKQVTEHFPPSMDLAGTEKPHRLIAGQSGDLGLAILWVVQTVLVRRVLESAVSSEGDQLPPTLEPHMIGALAHSEPKDAPVLISTAPDGKKLLSGTKSYITGGLSADLILVTARPAPEEKTDTLAALTLERLSEDHIREIDLQSLNTINHGRMTLKNYELDPGQVIPCSPRDLRKSILVMSTLERDFIMEAYITFMEYLNSRFKDISGTEAVAPEVLRELLAAQEATTAKHLKAMGEGSRLEPGLLDFKGLINASRQIEERGNEIIDKLSPNLKTRLFDLKFFQSMGR